MGGRMDSPHIPLTGSPWFRPLWAEVGHGAGDKPLFVGTSAKRRGVAASDDRWLAGWLVGHRRWNLHVCSVRCRASTSLSISGCIAIDAHLGSDEASSVILFSSQMLPVNPAATHTHTSTHSNGPMHQRLSLWCLHILDGAAQTTAEAAPLSAKHVFPEKRAERLRSRGVLETPQRRKEGDVRAAPMQTSTSKHAGGVERDSYRHQQQHQQQQLS